ncbi:MAG: type II secretion system protein [Synergistaceae bacterium]|nr:type II secretion system protein [Synergistaceae bacterium]
MTKVKKIYFHKSFTMIEVLIVVAIFATLTATISVITNSKDNKLFLDECEKIRNFVCESIEIASSRNTEFTIAVNTVHEGGYSTKAVIVCHKNGALEKYEYLYLKYADMDVEEKCTFDGASFTMTPALSWKIWKSGDKYIVKTLTISGNGYCTLQ